MRSTVVPQRTKGETRGAVGGQELRGRKKVSRGSAESEPQQEATQRFEAVFLLTWEKQAKWTALVNQAGDVGGKPQCQLSLDVLRFTLTSSLWCWRQHGQHTVY